MCIKTIAALVVSGGLLIADQPLGNLNDASQTNRVEKEAALGRRLAESFRQQHKPLDSLMVGGYIRRLSQLISVQVPDAEFPFDVGVIVDDPCPTIHEPIALPGGNIFVPSALFLAAQSEAEFAGMLAQAMERIALHAGVHQVTREQITQLAAIPVILVGTGCTEGQLVPLVQRRNNLETDPQSAYAIVLKADVFAIQVMARTGFDPAELMRYIERVQPDNHAYTIHTALPDRDQRVAGMRLAMENLPRLTYPVHDDEFRSMQQEVRRFAEHRTMSAAPPTLKRKGEQ